MLVEYLKTEILLFLEEETSNYSLGPQAETVIALIVAAYSTALIFGPDGRPKNKLQEKN